MDKIDRKGTMSIKDKGNSISRKMKEPPVNNAAFITMLDKAYAKKDYHKADLKKVASVRSAVQNTHIEKKQLVPPKLVFSSDGLTLTRESYEECLDFYDSVSDELTAQILDLDKLAELDFWLICLIEPFDYTNPEAWYTRELNKIIQCHSNNLNPIYRQLVSYKLRSRIPESKIGETSVFLRNIMRIHMG